MAEIGKWLRESGVLSKDSLRFITSIRYDASLMKALNNMTFFFDVNWEGDGKTLPMAFFYITNFSEVMTSEISQKTMLFYNSGTANPDSTKGGLLGVVADNIVNKPKKYKLDVVIPASFTQIDKIYQFDSYTRNIVMTKQLSDLESEGAVPLFISALSTASTNLIASLINSLITALTVEDFLKTDVITSLLTLNTSNKDSLTAMWGNRTILKMKVPNGWKFKYVALEALNINKKGEDGDFFTGTIEVTELPILTVDKGRRFSPLAPNLGAFKKAGIGVFESIMNKFEKAL